MTTDLVVPGVEFFTLYPDANPPVPASETVSGSLPVRAQQFCPPVVAGSGLGWYLFPPVDFALRWDGQESELAFVEDGQLGSWHPLAGAVDLFLPDGIDHFGALPEARRDALKGMLPPEGLPIANADPRAMNVLELQFGLVVRTPPGWHSLVRSVPNWPFGGYQVLDGILETSWFRGLVPVVVRLTDPGRVVRFFRDFPAAALQLVPESSCRRETKAGAVVVRGAAAFPEDVWREHAEIRSTRFRHERPGNYRLEQRRHTSEGDLADPADPADAADPAADPGAELSTDSN